MTFNGVFGNSKPVIGMIHTNKCDGYSMLELAKKEIEFYLANGVSPLIENFSGKAMELSSEVGLNTDTVLPMQSTRTM